MRLSPQTPPRLSVALCLLTWNEEAGCAIDLPRIPQGEFDDIFAIDNNSTDATRMLLQSAGIRVVTQTRPSYNGAVIQAFEHCPCDALVIFHPKATIDPMLTSACARHLRSGADLVIASRNHREGRNEEDDRLLKPRKWFVTLLSRTCSLLWRCKGTRATDVLHGFRGMRKDAFFSLEPRPAGVSIDLEMVVRAYRKKLAIEEFACIEHARGHGSTHFPAFRTGKRLLTYMASELRRAA